MPIDYQGLAMRIAARIHDAILEGRLTVDERLPTEDELAARFSVPRPTIREALKRPAATVALRGTAAPAGCRRSACRP